MKKNNLDEFFRQKLNQTAFQAKEEDWENVLMAMNRKSQFSAVKLYWLLLLLPLLILGIIFYFPTKASNFAEPGSFGLDRNIFTMSPHPNDHTEGNTLGAQKINNPKSKSDSPKSISPKSSHPVTYTIKSTRKNSIAKTSGSAELQYREVYKENTTMVDEKTMSAAPLTTLDTKTPGHETDQKSDLMHPLEPGEIQVPENLQMLPFQLFSTGYPDITTMIPPTKLRKRTMLEVETTLGVNNLARQFGIDIYYSLMRVGSFRTFVGAGIFYRQTDSHLLASMNYPGYGFGLEEREASLYGVGKTMLNIPLRVSYHLNRNSSIQAGVIFSKHLAGRGWTELPTDQNRSDYRHWIIDDYYDNWVIAGQLHYRYEWNWGGIGGGVRIERMGPLERMIPGSNRDNYLLLFECKISKKI